jgi:hypothetical protein
MDESLEIQFLCCFCGRARGDADPITITASWSEEGRERWQAWGAHRECFIERLSEDARRFGGPLLED